MRRCAYCGELDIEPGAACPNCGELYPVDEDGLTTDLDEEVDGLPDDTGPDR